MTDEIPPFRSANRSRFQPVKYKEDKLAGETQGKNEQPDTEEKKRTKPAWYKQTTVWAVISSILALILSQLPPVRTWIPKDELKAETNNKIGLPIMVGIPVYQIFIDLKNTGNRSLTISNLELEITYPDSIVKHYEAQSFLRILEGQPTPQNFPITSIMLDVGKGWAEMIMFYAPQTPSEEEEISHFQSQIADSIFSKMEIAAGRYKTDLVTRADDSTVAQAIDFFNRKFNITKGVYKASLNCTMNKRKVRLKEFEFTLYDHHITTLKSQIRDYKFGWGVYGPVAPFRQVWASLSEERRKESQ